MGGFKQINMSGGYFTQPSDSIHHNGISTDIIKNGDTQTIVNEKLSAAIEKLTKGNGCIGNTTTPITTINTDELINKSGFGATNSFVSSPYQIKMETKAKSEATEMSYDLADAIDSTDKLSYSRVVIEGKQGIIVDTDKISSGVRLAPENFPATISIDIRKETKGGEMQYLSTKAQINPTDSKAPVTLFKREMGGTELKTQSDVNNFLKERLDTIQKSNVNTVNYEGQNINLQETVNRLLIEINELKGKLAQESKP